MQKKAMGKKYNGIIWGFFKEWWSFPKIGLSSIAVFIIFISLRLPPAGDSKFLSVNILLLLIAMPMGYRVIQLKRMTEGAERKWLLQELIYNQGLDMVQKFLFLPLLTLMIGNKSGLLENLYGQLIFSSLVVAVLLLFIISAITIPSKAEELLAETYPEYKLQ
jgi:hypothetical protein